MENDVNSNAMPDKSGAGIYQAKRIGSQDKSVYYLSLMQSACIADRLKEVYQKEKKNLTDKLAEVTISGSKDLPGIQSDLKKLEAAYRYFLAPVFTVMSKKFAEMRGQIDFLVKQNKALSQEIDKIKNAVADLEMKSNAILPPDSIYGLNESGIHGKISEEQFSDIVELGIYPYERDGRMRPIEWIVLEKYDDNTALLISKYGLDSKPYNMEYMDVSWETCTLRDWLNNSFYNIAFSAREQYFILDAGTVSRPKSGTGKDEEDEFIDKIFVLSAEEAEHYFSNDSSRRAKPTPYAVQRGAYINGTGGWWWLRNAGQNTHYAAAVSIEGAINQSGLRVNSDTEAVRVAMKINLELLNRE